MKILDFNKKRTILFIVFLSIFLLPLFFRESGGGIGLICIIFSVMFINIVGVLFKWTNLFDFQEFGAYPEGLFGWIIVVGFYLILAFLLSGVINFFKKNN